MAVFPGHPPVSILRHLDLESDGRNVEFFQLGSHTGTHIELPRHYIKNGSTSETCSLGTIVGPALLMDFSQTKEGKISAQNFQQYETQIKDLKRVVIKTGWNTPGDAYYCDYPTLSVEACKLLTELKIEMIGIDTPSPGPYGEEGEEIHRLFLNKKIYIIEGLTNLKNIRENVFLFICLPLYLTGAGGVPCRAIAVSDLTIS